MLEVLMCERHYEELFHAYREGQALGEHLRRWAIFGLLFLGWAAGWITAAGWTWLRGR
jgi:hypothetical protein